LAEPLQGTLACQPAYLDGGNAAAMGLSALEQFLAHVQADPALRRQVSEAITADEVSLLAQELGYPVSGSDLLRFSGRSAAGVRVTRIDHPGEYPGRYV
jgi:predicted ribosomally synthesized peptide with nif11-like leader